MAPHEDYLNQALNPETAQVRFEKSTLLSLGIFYTRGRAFEDSTTAAHSLLIPGGCSSDDDSLADGPLLQGSLHISYGISLVGVDEYSLIDGLWDKQSKAFIGFMFE